MRVSTTAERLKTIMRERNLKQVDILNACKPFSEKYNIKLAKNDLSQYISGKVEPRQDKLSILSLALNVSEVWLMGYDVPPSPTSAEDASTTKACSKGVPIPVYGRVAAGIPMEAIEYIIDLEEIPEQLSRLGEYFGLQIAGDSMEPRICDHDVVIVRQQPDAESGDIVIAMVNGSDATCKRLRKYADGMIELISTNPSYDPMVFTREEQEDKPVKIIGKVIELRGKLE